MARGFIVFGMLALLGLTPATNAGNCSDNTWYDTSSSATSPIAAGKTADPEPIRSNLEYLYNCLIFNGSIALKGGFDTEVLRIRYNDAAYHSVIAGFHGDVPEWNYVGFNVLFRANDVRRVMTLRGNGSVGIGTTSPSYTLDVNGTFRYSNATPDSDRRLKTDIAPIASDVLAKLMMLRPVIFRWKNPKDDGMKGLQIGLIAQEVEKVLPSTVTTARDAMKTKGIKYNELTAVLIKAVQEQQQQIDALRVENTRLRGQYATVQRQAKQISDLRHANDELSHLARTLTTRLDRLERLRLAKAQ